MIMSRQITVTISEKTYEQAKYLADLRRQPVADVLAEHLSRTLPGEDEVMFPQIDPDPIVEKERNAYLALHSELWQKYPHEYVAIYQGQLIDHDKNKLALIQRINEQYPDDFVLVRQVEMTPEIVYQFHN
jgi:hypothetical protein